METMWLVKSVSKMMEQKSIIQQTALQLKIAPEILVQLMERKLVLPTNIQEVIQQNVVVIPMLTIVWENATTKMMLNPAQTKEKPLWQNVTIKMIRNGENVKTKNKVNI